MTTFYQSVGRTTRVRPGVYVGLARTRLSDRLAGLLLQVVVDSSIDRPDMFELTFADQGAAAEILRQLPIGTAVRVSTAPVTDPGGHATLITGEVTALEGRFAESSELVVRGYSAEHRLQRARHTRTFVQMTDADIARKVILDAGLVPGTITPTPTVHEYVAQVNQTDWEFLRERAAAAGMRTGARPDGFDFTEPADPSGRAGASLTYPTDLYSFTPRITAGNLGGHTEARGWDVHAAKATGERATPGPGSATLPGHTPATVAAPFVPSAKPSAVSATGTADLGPAPATDAEVAHLTLPAGPTASAQAGAMARGRAGQLADTFAEAEGEGEGDPRLLAGTVVQVSGVSPPFLGNWVINRARHVLIGELYTTSVELGGAHDRSLLGLTRNAAPAGTGPGGLACGVVSNTNDPLRRGRVRVTLPWLSPEFDSDWAPVSHPGAGRDAGAIFLPEVGDEVLVGFEFGDPQRPFVLGGLTNQHSRFSLGGQLVQVNGQTAAVVRRGIVSPSGTGLIFHDERPPGEGRQPPLASSVTIGTGNGSLCLALDEVAGTATLSCKPAPPNSKSTIGQLTIECGDAGTINIRSGAGGTVTVDGGAMLNLKAQAAVKIESQGVVEIKGTQIKLN